MSNPLPHLSSDPAASMLLGLVLNQEWEVIKTIPQQPHGTGGFFSNGNIVRSPSRGEAFLKALDYSGALHASSPAEELQALTAAFLFEARLLDLCVAKRMTKVVRAIDRGSVLVPGCAIPTVEYLIFELAEGDIRTYLSIGKQLELAWTLRTLHQVATGLSQLHRAQVAHQDLKPSNVLTFDRGANSKIADLGRASVKGQVTRHDLGQIAGDWGYAPPELLYGDISPDWNARRQACDLYHFGSLIVFLFAMVSVTPLLLQKLPRDKQRDRWGGGYRDVLPHVQSAFSEVLADVEASFPDAYRGDLTRMVRELCEPDPTRRGHPKNRRGHVNPFSLERYVSDLNALASRAEAQLKKRI